MRFAKSLVVALTVGAIVGLGVGTQSELQKAFGDTLVGIAGSYVLTALVVFLAAYALSKLGGTRKTTDAEVDKAMIKLARLTERPKRENFSVIDGEPRH